MRSQFTLELPFTDTDGFPRSFNYSVNLSETGKAILNGPVPKGFWVIGKVGISLSEPMEKHTFPLLLSPEGRLMAFMDGKPVELPAELLEALKKGGSKCS